MMDCTKRYSVVLLLMLSAIVLFGESEKRIGVVACPQYCLDVSYMTCESSGDKRLPARCNCCLAPKNCILHLSDGTQQICS